MENIELVIKIPKELYEAYKGRPPMLGDAGMDMIAQAIANGIPLPKGHGKIGDFDAFLKGFLFDKRADNLECGWIRELIEQVTIIEADKESEEK